MNASYDFAPYLIDQSNPVRSALNELNKKLQEIDLPVIDFSKFSRVVDRQIQTAEKDFTICFYGSFNSGKSTIINSFLQLPEESRLSAKDSPDTAKSIRLSNWTEGRPEVTILYNNGKTENTTWEKAKNLTSQVYLDKHPDLTSTVKDIVEIEYFIKENPVLQLCSVVDLPGTGTAFGDSHGSIANERIKESEIIFWVVPTSRPEPDGNELRNLRNLQNLSAKIVPMINVWQDSEVGISGLVKPDYLEQLVLQKFSSFFPYRPQVLTYYGRECDKAAMKGEEPKEFTGYQALKEFLQSYLAEDALKLRDDKIKRISGSLLKDLEALGWQVQEADEALVKLLEHLKGANDESSRLRNECEELEQEIRLQIGYQAKLESDELIQIFTSRAEAFLEKQMSSFNLNLLKSKSKKEAIKKSLEEEFKVSYLELGKKDGIVNSRILLFMDVAAQQIKHKWQRFINQPAVSQRLDDFVSGRGENFVSHLFSNINLQGANKGLDFVIGGSFLLVLAGIPGGQIVLVLAALGYIGKKIFGQDVDVHKKKSFQEARILISQYKSQLELGLIREAMKIHEDIEKKYLNTLDNEKSGRDEKANQLLDGRKSIVTAQRIISEFADELQGWLTRELTR